MRLAFAPHAFDDLAAAAGYVARTTTSRGAPYDADRPDPSFAWVRRDTPGEDQG
jgi:hypothetical protein